MLSGSCLLAHDSHAIVTAFAAICNLGTRAKSLRDVQASKIDSLHWWVRVVHRLSYHLRLSHHLRVLGHHLLLLSHHLLLLSHHLRVLSHHLLLLGQHLLLLRCHLWLSSMHRLLCCHLWLLTYVYLCLHFRMKLILFVLFKIKPLLLA